VCNSIRLSWHLNKKTVGHCNQRIACVYVTLTVRKLLCNWFDGNVGGGKCLCGEDKHYPSLTSLSPQSRPINITARVRCQHPSFTPEYVIKLLSLDLSCLIIPYNAATETLMFCLGFQCQCRTVAPKILNIDVSDSSWLFLILLIRHNFNLIKKCFASHYYISGSLSTQIYIVHVLI